MTAPSAALALSPDQVRLPVAVGIRLRDVATRGYVRSDLAVTVRRDVALSRSYPLQAVTSGHWVSHTLAERYRARADASTDWPAIANDYAIAVDAPSGEYLPLRATGKLPRQGSFAWDGWPAVPPARLAPMLDPGATLSPAPGWLPLFPSSTYRAGTLGRVHAHLAFRNAAGGVSDAAWALMSVSLGSAVIGIGMSDARGSIGAFFPYPPLPDLTPQQKAQGRPRVEWPVSIAVHSAALPADNVPTLDAVLGQIAQPPRFIHDSLSSLATKLASQTLVLGQPLVLRTGPAAGGAQPSSLFIKTP